jgi:hypothetical protein
MPDAAPEMIATFPGVRPLQSPTNSVTTPLTGIKRVRCPANRSILARPKSARGEDCFRPI